MKRLLFYVACFLISINSFCQQIESVTNYKVINDNLHEYQKTIYSYDENDHLINLSIKIWDEDKLAYIDNFQDIYTNNSEGIPEETITQDWQDGWKNRSKILDIYNIDNLLVEKIKYSANGDNEWVNSERNAPMYENGRLIYILQQVWDTDSEDYKNFKEYNYTYNENGLSEQLIIKEWKNEIWVNSKRCTSTYNENGEENTYLIESWKNGNWENSSLYTYEYDDNNMSGYLIQSWSNDSFVNDTYLTYLYGDQGLSEITHKSWDATINEWSETYKHVYTYRPSAGIHYENISDFSVFPNPVTDLLNIKLEESSVAVAEIFDTQGKLLLRNTVSVENYNINIKHLPAGQYILQITQNNKTSTSKFIKE